ncbi:hypothetical protein TeGR_g15222 [Tetraparma gracilis]|uniref:Uncharacterized protein n=1 Tax=Tetraparma gracilis TaxID=2962635 RepID=A0ABQ6MAE5_9STRA|nr:hypothetical protein TeGR_g15222 [Tetraparma gracilis]
MPPPPPPTSSKLLISLSLTFVSSCVLLHQLDAPSSFCSNLVRSLASLLTLGGLASSIDSLLSPPAPAPSLSTSGFPSNGLVLNPKAPPRPPARTPSPGLRKTGTLPMSSLQVNHWSLTGQPAPAPEPPALAPPSPAASESSAPGGDQAPAFTAGVLGGSGTKRAGNPFLQGAPTTRAPDQSRPKGGGYQCSPTRTRSKRGDAAAK